VTEQSQYALGYREAEQDRLQRQAEQLAADSAALFDAVGASAGQRVLELGCGPRGSLEALAARVGPSGAVVGIDLSPDAVALARSFVEAQGLSNVEVQRGDASSTGLDPGSFDLVTARLVLVNIPSPERIVAEAVSLVRPGGVVALHEVDFAGNICDPPCDAWSNLIDIYLQVARTNGNDYFLGRRLGRILRDAGLIDVQVRAIMHEHPIGDPRRELIVQFAENFRPAVVAQQLLPEDRYDELIERAREHLADPDTTVFIGPYIQAFGRKPD
jgi:ubiquinone/menaquinone biosynthesis C-methylase UbiE